MAFGFGIGKEVKKTTPSKSRFGFGIGKKEEEPIEPVEVISEEEKASRQQRVKDFQKTLTAPKLGKVKTFLRKIFRPQTREKDLRGGDVGERADDTVFAKTGPRVEATEKFQREEGVKTVKLPDEFFPEGVDVVKSEKQLAKQAVKDQIEFQTADEFRKLEMIKDKAGKVMTAGIVWAMISNPLTAGVALRIIPVAKALLTFAALAEAENAFVQFKRGDKFKFGTGREVSELFDIKTAKGQATADIIEFAAKAIITGGVLNLKSPKLSELFIKELGKKYNIPTKLHAQILDRAKLLEKQKAKTTKPKTAKIEPQVKAGKLIEPKVSKVKAKAEKVITEPLKPNEVEIFHGVNKKIIKAKINIKDSKIKKFEDSQLKVITDLAKNGNKKAKVILDDSVNFFQKANKLLRDKYKNDFDFIKYENKKVPAKGNEYYDLKTNKFFAEERITAEVYARQNRTLKFESTKEFIKESKKIKVPKEEALKPVEKPTKISKVARSIEAKAIEKGLVDKGFGELAGFESTTIKKQAKLASETMKDIELAKDIATGKAPLPKGLKGATILKTMEDYAIAKKDGALIAELAKSPLVSETSSAAQTLRLIAEREPDSATAKIKEITKAREKSAKKKRLGQKKSKIKSNLKKDLKKKIAKKKITKTNWDNFVDDIKC